MPLTFEEKSQRLTQALSYFRASELAFRKGLTQLVEVEAESREPVLLAMEVGDLAKLLYGIDATAVGVDLAIDHLSRGELRSKGGPIAAEPATPAESTTFDAGAGTRVCAHCGVVVAQSEYHYAGTETASGKWCTVRDADGRKLGRAQLGVPFQPARGA